MPDLEKVAAFANKISALTAPPVNDAELDEALMRAMDGLDGIASELTRVIAKYGTVKPARKLRAKAA